MPITEHTINDALAAVLRDTRRAWSQPGVVSSENIGILKHGAKRPDILVTEPNVSPVVIETEVMPAATVEVEAVSRLGEQVKSNGRAILSSVAVRLPARLRTKSGATLTSELVKVDDLDVAILHWRLAEDIFAMATVRLDPGEHSGPLDPHAVSDCPT